MKMFIIYNVVTIEFWLSTFLIYVFFFFRVAGFKSYTCVFPETSMYLWFSVGHIRDHFLLQQKVLSHSYSDCDYNPSIEQRINSMTQITANSLLHATQRTHESLCLRWRSVSCHSPTDWKKWMWRDSPAFQSQHKWRRSWRWGDLRTAEPVDSRRDFSEKRCGGWYTNRREIHGVCHTDLKGLDKSPEQRSNAFAFTEQLDQPQHSKQAEEGDGHFSTFTFALKQKHTERKTHDWVTHVSLAVYTRIS